jgi:hypothetical protein
MIGVIRPLSSVGRVIRAVKFTAVVISGVMISGGSREGRMPLQLASPPLLLLPTSSIVLDGPVAELLQHKHLPYDIGVSLHPAQVRLHLCHETRQFGSTQSQYQLL